MTVQSYLVNGRKAEVKLEESWGTQRIGARTDIRRKVIEVHETSNTHEVLQFLERPTLKHGYVSISHCTSLGGYAYSDWPLGFDVEVLANVNSLVLKGIAAGEEDISCPLLWSAKEAVFKAIPSSHQPQSLSSICIRWLGEGESARYFDCPNSSFFAINNLSGFAWKTQTHSMALFL